MYLRRKKAPSGKVLQLLEAFRNSEGQPRQRVVLSLGNAAVPEEHWEQIGRLVEQRLYGRPGLFDGQAPSTVREWVDTIVRRVDLRGRWRPARRGRDEAQEEPCAGGQESEVVDGVLIDEVTHTHGASLGPELVARHVWNRLRMPECLERLGCNALQRQVAAASVINRLADPVSDHGMIGWIERSAIRELLGEGAEALGAGKDRFYRITDKLLENQDAIEAHLRREQRKAFSLTRTIFLYDLTNTYFEGVMATNEKARRGKSKEKRNDCPQIVVGMVFDQYGFELAHRVFEGNRNDATTLVDMVGTLQAVVREEADLFSARRPLVIMDAGVATRKNRKVLRGEEFDYLVNDSRRGRKAYRDLFLSGEGFSKISNREGGSEVEIRKIRDPLDSANTADQKADWLVLCKSEARRGKEEGIRSKAEERFVRALQGLEERVEKGRLQDREKIDQAVGRILARHPRVARFYHVAVEEKPSGCAPEVAAAKPDTKAKGRSCQLAWVRKDDAYAADDELLGCYVLRTDREELGAEEIWHLYMTLTRAEDGFRALKSDLGLRPNRHHVEDRVDAHVFLTVLAYQIVQHVLHTLRQQGDTRNWDTLRRVLSTHCYVTQIVPTAHGKTYRLRKAGEPDEVQKAIYQALGVEWRKLPATKICTTAH
jgi:transposase